jgi:hypothetical protein
MMKEEFKLDADDVYVELEKLRADVINERAAYMRERDAHAALRAKLAALFRDDASK